VPYFEEGIRGDVIEAWRDQGLPAGADPSEMFQSDRREEPEVELDPIPELESWPQTIEELAVLRSRLDPADPRRLPADWAEHRKAGPDRDYTLMLEVHNGFFLSMGVRGWNRFSELMREVIEDKKLVRASMAVKGDFAAALAERLLDEVEIDAAVFSEPIGGNDRPLISPRMYEDLVLRSYEPLLDVLRNRGVETIIFRTYANARLLIPSILKWGFNCLWACEVNTGTMDYRALRREFGRDLRLVGGIDLDALRVGKDAIRREIEEKVPPLLADGGYVPLADGRVRPEVSFQNYIYYRSLLREITSQGPHSSTRIIHEGL
jgi:uroporphyrinogen decarboxylase